MITLSEVSNYLISIQVANFSALPPAASNANKMYYCIASQGTRWLPGSWGGTYYPSGWYRSNGATWEYQETAYQASLADVVAGVIQDQFVSPYTLKQGPNLDQSGSKNYATAAGTDTYTATITPAITGYSTGQQFYINFVNPNTGASTVNLNGLGAINIVDSAGANVSAGTLKGIMPIVFNGIDFQVAGGSGGGSSADLNLLKSTGCLTGGVIAIGTGGAGIATTFSISSGTGQVVDNSVSPTVVTPVSWATQTDVVITNLGSSAVTYVAIDSLGNVQQSTTPWTPSQSRTYIQIGVVSHPNNTTVSAVNTANAVAYNALNQFQDLTYSLGLFNVSGNVFTANGANLNINKSSGFVFRQGGNYSSLSVNPHVVTTGSISAGSFRMVNQTGSAGALITSLDVTNYDLAGVTTPLPVNKFAIHRVYLFTSNLFAVQRAQQYYNSLAEAKAAIQNESFVVNSGLSNGLLRGFIVFKQGATALNNATQAFFLEAPKFGGSAGVGGLSVSTLQNAYDNSSTPEITTDATRGAVTIKRGSAADTDNVMEWQNGAGTTNANVTGEGNATFNNIPTIGQAIALSTGASNLF